MYLVKLDLSVKGLPKNLSLCIPRHLSQVLDCKVVSEALKLVRDERSAPKLELALQLLFCCLYDIVCTNSLSGVVMSARYTLFNISGVTDTSGVLVADYTRYYNFDYYAYD